MLDVAGMLVFAGIVVVAQIAERPFAGPGRGFWQGIFVGRAADDAGPTAAPLKAPTNMASPTTMRPTFDRLLIARPFLRAPGLPPPLEVAGNGQSRNRFSDSTFSKIECQCLRQITRSTSIPDDLMQGHGAPSFSAPTQAAALSTGNDMQGAILPVDPAGNGARVTCRRRPTQRATALLKPRGRAPFGPHR